MIQTVTFGVIAYNEHEYLPTLINDLLFQTYPKNLIEVILVDGDSADDTWSIMQDFQLKHLSEYRDIRILKNPKRIQPAGWNLVISNMSSEVLIRVDAHARLPKDFVENSINCLNSGEFVCGGPRENIIDSKSAWKQLLLLAEKSAFGAGGASYRQDTDQRRYVKSVFHAAYLKEVLDKTGMFNEHLVRTEDNEYHYRIRRSGYSICYDPHIKSYYQTRNSLKGMIKQKFLNGLWIGRTLFVCPGCISLFHLVPFAFVIAIVLTAMLSICGIKAFMLLLWGLYIVADLLMTIIAAINEKYRSVLILFLPLLFLMIHLCYGTGTIVGIIKGKNHE